MSQPAQTKLPRWRGFNLLNAFYSSGDGTFLEDDFRWISEWGFDFVRLPMTYGHWTVDGDWDRLDESFLDKIDRVIEFGDRYGIHVDLNFHHAPGFSVNSKITPRANLWKDPEPLSAFCEHWRMFARRYAGVPSQRLSFNLVNEPKAIGDSMSRDDHERVVRTAVAAIREIDPERLIIADGTSWGNVPTPELSDLGIAQSCRAYVPIEVSHFKAHWIKRAQWPEPAWPMTLSDGSVWDRSALAKRYEPWIELARSGVGVHCGEGGAYSFTPHDVFLAWFEDVLSILTDAGIGYALWNFRGPFGVLDTKRREGAFEDWHGHALDRKLLDLLRRY